MEMLNPRNLKIANWVVLGLLVVIGYFWLCSQFALGVLVGGLVVVVNFHLLHRALKDVLERATMTAEEARARSKALFAARQLLRFFALLAIIFWLVRSGWVNVIGLLVGLSTVVLTLILVAIHEVIKLKDQEANPSHGTSHPVS